jgi:hypothetical protein
MSPDASMREPQTSLAGGCHCGNLRVLFESAHPVSELPLRACTCSFCRTHGVRTTVDPQGRLTIWVRDPEQLSRYRFGGKTADYLICRSCGAYVAAVMQKGDAYVGTLNVNVLDVREIFRQPAIPANYEGEATEERKARRATTWTPTVLPRSSANS